MTDNDKKRIYKELAAPFTDEAIERSDGRVTGKGYSTTGIKYQYVVNRLNEVIGIGSWRTQQETTVREGATAKGRPVFDATCELTLQFGEWVDGIFKPWAEAHATGGHQSVNEADCRKGAFTNSLKKSAAMFGCGKQAYEGTLDDDNAPAFEDGDQQGQQQTRQPQPSPVRTEQPHQAPTRTEQNPRPVSQANGNGTTNGDGATGNGNASRNRLSSKQLGALWAISRKLNIEQGDFRKRVRAKYGCQPEFLDRKAASALIDELAARASNGASHPAGEHAGQSAGA